MTQRILSIDTCGLQYSIAILRVNADQCECIASLQSHHLHMQCEELITAIEKMLIENSMTYNNINTIAVTAGPGSFNGVRIGFAAAQGISIATGIDISTVSTLEVVLYKHLLASREIQFPAYVCFKADPNNGFIYRFASADFKDCIDDPQPITTSELEELKCDFTVIDFTLQSFADGDISNAVAAGAIASSRKLKVSKIFYGKPPSIN